MTGWVNYQAPQSASSDQEEDLREAIRNASAVILVASAHTRRSRSGEARVTHRCDVSASSLSLLDAGKSARGSHTCRLESSPFL